MSVVADMDRRKERMRNECKKIVDSINLMSFDNLDDQSVHSLVKMKEIARGVLYNHVEKVRERETYRMYIFTFPSYGLIFIFIVIVLYR